MKSLIINAEVARIEAGRLLVVTDDGNAMREVTPAEFKEFLKEISYVCLTSWNEELRNNYIEFVQYFDKLR